MNSLEITKKLLRENNIVAKKRFGQNFLIDDNILEQIVKDSQISEKDTIIEIGPGLGNLTSYIEEKAKKVIAFEIDEDMQKILEKRFNDSRKVQVILKDILSVNLKDYVEDDKKLKIIANLPYYITTPIVFKLLEQSQYISQIIVMVQREVADRIIASPHSKDYGVLTINVNYLANVEKLFDVPNYSFIPEPNVVSSVIKIIPDEEKKEKYEVIDEALLQKIIKGSFMARRKKLINSLEMINISNIDKEKLRIILNNLGIRENSRAEELKIEEFVKLSNEIKKIQTD